VVLGKLVREQLAEGIGGEPSEKPRRVTETGHRAGGVERAAAWAGVDAPQRLDDQVDEALTPDQDH
jgi:hypothetical protein